MACKKTCPCRGMPNVLQNNKLSISLGKVELFCLFIACSYTSREAKALSCLFSCVCSSMRKVLWNNKSPISLERVKWFCWFLCAIIWILSDIHWSYRNLLFWASIVRHGLSDNQIVRCFEFKNLKTIWGIKLIFCFHWSYKKYHAILGYDPKILFANHFAGFFTFDLFDLLILIPGFHCYTVLVSLMLL